ncbi:MAG: hypothetical protein H6658_13920 [Ardenticatenaceae bacterium]|nr:hypothetical protein [Ardenticatenaceae bacterium]
MSILAFFLGFLIVVYTFISATRTFVMPRSARVWLTSFVFRVVLKLFSKITKFLPTYEQRDALMAMYAPLSLLFMVPAWLLFTTIGYTFMFWALGITPLLDAFVLSGSSILTLGFATGDTLAHTLLAFSEATVGLILVAMLISYLPTMYSAFATREKAVSLLEVRAGSPPTAPELIWRLSALTDESGLQGFWEKWEEWFTEIDENHTSLAALVFFRSPQPQQSWVTAAAAVLDAAALFQSTVERPYSAYPNLVLRSGTVALRHIADFFQVAYNPDPHFPADPISVTRVEFDEAYDRLQSQGIALHPDRDDAWQNFAGWRVNYDSLLVALARLTMAPDTPWLSDYTFVPVTSSAGRSGGALQKVR